MDIITVPTARGRVVRGGSYRHGSLRRGDQGRAGRRRHGRAEPDGRRRYRGRPDHSVGRLDRADARRVIEADGRFVTPGFVDIHTHSDIGILQDPTAENIVRQGVTTHVTGNCGGSPAPDRRTDPPLAERQFPDYGHPVEHEWSSFGEYLGRARPRRRGREHGPAHRSRDRAPRGARLRTAAATGAELGRMRAHVDEAMRGRRVRDVDRARVPAGVLRRDRRDRGARRGRRPTRTGCTPATSGASGRPWSTPCGSASRSASGRAPDPGQPQRAEVGRSAPAPPT